MTQAPSLKKIDGVYHARVQAGGKTKWISTGSDNKAEAEKILAESGVEQINLALKAGQLTRKAIGQALAGMNLTCAKALEKYREMRLVSQSSKTVANHVSVVSQWMKAARTETLPPSAITPQHIGKWINHPKLAWKSSTRQVALASLRSFFIFCSDQGWIVSDPAQQVEIDYNVMSHEQKEGSDKQPFTDEEIKFLLSELRKDWKQAGTGKHELFRDPEDVLFWLVAVSIAKETGFRLSDVAMLEWRSFSKGGCVAVWTGKANRRVELPISDSLQELISEVPVNDPDYVFPAQRALMMNLKKRSFLSVQFGRLLERLNIKDRSFHSLRHYKATHAFAKMDKLTLAKKLAEVLTMEQIAALLGHASSKTTKGYIH